MTLLASELSYMANDKRLAACLILFLLELFIDGAKSATRAEIENHLELGKELLARGQLTDALIHYHAAIEGDPTNYLTLFKRGTVYLALGKTRLAISDFSRVLELKPDFNAARIQRGTVYMKIGDYHNAAIDYSHALEADPHNYQINEHYNRLSPALEQWELVQEVKDRGDYKTAIVLLTQLLEISPWSTDFRQTRAECYIEEDDILSAISDLRSVNKLSQDSTEGYYRIAELLYSIGHATSSLKEIRECLKLDPEHKDCFPFYKKIRKVEKALAAAEEYRDQQQYQDCIESAEIALKNEKEVAMIQFSAYQLLCNCYMRNEQYTEAIGKCREALNVQKDAGVLCDRAESYIGTEMFDDAIHDYQAAIEIDENNRRAKEGLEKAKRLQKQSERRDYYKILGVKRNAQKKEITKAYRKLAQKWHPDNFHGDEKKIAEKKFIDIAAAKEVLTDPEKRQQFDNGQDPLDPESNTMNGFKNGNPFAHFQHGSPFQFKFHFS
ncbi:dnaJ homolog subfamily C member 3 [Condylostylus longicornis]|uniref:dnaJ homolog subfamily C member 3 n=1 Tax=Condylostylus longicornis TaxID=2530218 RepID=UPI00244DF8D3|nr:dnaJ homolog subfamily C member 3 [Condylostylus longicornis]